MCGITAIISLNNESINQYLLESATNIISHRGPDGAGYYIGNNFALGHRRLAVIDLSDSGKQPMERHELVITFNGEIFNYIELREELISRGFVFQTETDTEVILQAYNCWGQNCQNHFIGMWSFVIYDKKLNILFCSRDRFFQKPMLFTKCDDLFMIGSEIKQFTVNDKFISELNIETTYDFFTQNRLNHTSSTFFKNVSSLGGGYQLVYDLTSHNYNISKWYKPNINHKFKGNFSTAKNHYYNLLKDSIKMRLRSDVAIGVALSGGLDSSGILCLAHNIDKSINYQAITSCYKYASFDERFYAEQVASQTNSVLHKKFPELNDLISKNVLDDIVWYQEQPIISGSHFSEYSVFEEAAQKSIKVMLCGQGPDEHTAGYMSFYSYLYLTLLNQFRWLTLFNCLKSREGGLINNLKQFVGFLFLNSIRQKPSPNINYKKFRKKFQKSIPAIFHNIKSIRKYSLVQVFIDSIPYQAHSEDRNSMRFSIESRSPYLDHRLVEFALCLPDYFKINKNKTKIILREALKQVLPADIYNRKDKMGFVAPDEIWFKDSSTLLRPILLQSVEELKGLINITVIEQYDNFVAGKDKFSDIYLKIISLASLCRQYKIKIPT